MYRVDRNDGYGGVFIACHNTLASSTFQVETSCELVVCQIQLPNQPHLIICSLYRPPSSNVAYLHECCHQLETIRQNHPDSALWIAGDVNLPDIDWTNNSINNHQYSINLNQTFIDFLQDNALSQLVNYPTRGSKILDVFITNRPSLVESCNTIDGISDHEAVLVSSYVLAPSGHPIERCIYLWSRANFDAIKCEMLVLCDEFMNTYSAVTPVDVLWNKFLVLCNTGLAMVPTKTSSTQPKQPWITSNIKRLSRKKQRAYNRARSSDSPLDWSKYHDLKRQCQRDCRQAFNNYISSLVDPNSNKVTKRLWSYIKSKRHENTGIGPLTFQGTTYTDSKDKANVMADYFSSVFTSDDTTLLPEVNDTPLPGILPITVHVEGVAQLLTNIQPHKASGPDNLPARFLKEVANEIAPVLTLVFQASLDQGHLPNIWRTAAVVPIFKKGNRNEPNNYRPVSLTCICSKLLEHIVYSVISKHLEHHHTLCDQQHGFRKRRSCETQLISTVNDLAECLNQRGQCDVLLLDFSKAFDKVSHSLLYHKLSHYGIQGSLLSWLASFLSHRSQYVILDNQKSDTTRVLSGVPQGTVLAPLLFLMYINDLPSFIHNKIKLYADDVLLYCRITSPSDCVKLQQDLNLLVHWANKWKMTFNILKCEFLRVTNQQNPILHTYYIESSPIKEVSCAKYLGVTIDNKLSFNQHIQSISSKANQVNAFIYRNLRHCPSTVKCNCYKSMVRPILEYASIVWDPHTQSNINKIEAVQRRAARFCLNNFSTLSSVTSMMSTLNLPPLQQRRERAKLIMMYKIINDLVDIPKDYFTPSDSRLRKGYYNQLMTYTDSYKFSFFPSVIKLWNPLPSHVANSTSLDNFCNHLSNYTCAL